MCYAHFMTAPTYVSNPCEPAGRKEVEYLTDRAKRYRANQCPPEGPPVCAYCGASGRDIMIDHIDGNEANSEPRNLTWSCRSCNGKKAHTFREAGIGTTTDQFNPKKAGKPVGAYQFKDWLRIAATHQEELLRRCPLLTRSPTATPTRYM